MSTPEPYGLKPVDYASDIEKRDGSLATYAFPDFDDPNFDKDEAIAGLLEDDSPFPEVRSAVANTDDPDIPVSTIRAWVLGLIFAIIVPVWFSRIGLNQVLFFRYPTVTIYGTVAQLLIFPLGCLWARTMPNVKIFGAPLNPGLFSIKEHVLATVMASVGSTSAYAIDIVATQWVFYNQNYGFLYQWMLVMSTQLMGFSMGGICHRFLVNPPSMIWPSILVTCALFNTLHAQTHVGSSHHGISREKFFFYCFAASAVWYLVPGYLFRALSYFSWVCWIAPDNILVNDMFGHFHGMGMSLVTFDWSQITFFEISPLATPWWIAANHLAGFVFFYWFLTPLLHYTNVWSGKYMPITSSVSYDNRGGVYNVSRILNGDTTFNQQKYEAYSPLFISTAFAITYGLGFASVTAVPVHALLYFRKQIWTQSTNTNNQSDVHTHLMSRYPQVPKWWYLTIFLTMFAFGVVVIKGWPTKFPIQWFVLALIIAFLYVIPVGMLWAITGGSQVALNFLTELIIGYGLPGRPIAMMMFKTWGYTTTYNAVWFASDLKLGHYMKIPPRTMFCAQVVACVLAGTVQLSVQAWMFRNIPDICDPSQKDGFICPRIKVFGTASIIWGVIGPERQFSKGQIYYGLPAFCIIGVLCPLFTYLIGLKFPNTWIRYVNFPVIFKATIPDSTPINVVTCSIVGFIFQYIIRRRHFSWWAKYNYVLSAGLDSGVAVSALLIFLTLLYPKNGTIGQNSIQSWWGNTVFTKTADYLGTPLLKVAEGSHFGPETWH